MASSNLSASARSQISPTTDLVKRHLDIMARMVAIDSRSFNVNEFPGDRETPTDMKEILGLASDYLTGIGFDRVQINKPGPDWPEATPILMGELTAGKGKPTILLYAHLDKQPYMDDNQWKKWDGVAPTQLRWNKEGTRAYGRGAADDLSGVVAMGISIEALLRGIGWEKGALTGEQRQALPCNLKVIYETEEESGSHSLIAQIMQNHSFFADCNCVIITDVTNPATGIPGLTTSLRGVLQQVVTLHKEDAASPLPEQAALYQLLSTLIDEKHALAVKAIAKGDIPVTEEERAGYGRIPTDLEALCQAAGLLPGTKLVVPETVTDVMQTLLRTSYANVRPGHRVAGGVVFGAAGARLLFPLQEGVHPHTLEEFLKQRFAKLNPFHLQLKLETVEVKEQNRAAWNLIVQAADKDPHSGINGGPFPVAELQLARMVSSLFGKNGRPTIDLPEDLVDERLPIQVFPLHVEHSGQNKMFDKTEAKAVVEIRLAPGHDENRAAEQLRDHLNQHCPAGFRLEVEADKGGPPWMTGIEHPAFSQMLQALETGYEKPPCLFGCGGSIPFVAKLMEALGNCPPLCLGAYDPDCAMHEPNESLSMVDLLGCARSIVDFICRAPEIFPDPSQGT